MNASFCTCTDTKCAQHPQNHENGCTPCMAKNLARGEVPACIFRKVHNDLSVLDRFEMEDFVAFYLAHKGEPATL